MKRSTLLLSTLVPLLLVGGYLLFGRSGPERVLVFSKTEGYRHASIEPGLAAIRQLGAEHGWRVTATEDARVFTPDSLAAYQAVVFLNTTGDVLDEAQQTAFRRYIQAGGGYVGVHAASDTEYGWPWYGELVGGYFDGHPGNPNVREATLHVANADHPSTTMLPEPWTRTDEWYDIRRLQDDVTVLLTIDETTYKSPDENPAAAPRPIAWYHAFDGGRAWYTALGHTEASYAEPLFLQHLAGGLAWAIGDREPVDFGKASVMPEENRFTKTVLDQNLNEPMELAFVGDEQILFIERKGALKLHDLPTGQTRLVTTLGVSTAHEEGLIGIAADPNYAENSWIYLAYSDPDEPQIHLARFVFADGQLDRDSEKVLLSVPVQRDECCHVAGSIEFDGDGNLFLSIGDNTNPFASSGFGPTDERQGPRVCADNEDVADCDRSPWDAQKSSANTDDLRGKILRITPQPDGSYTVPEGNLFPGGEGGRPEIYVMGNRNPFRISIDPHTGYLYWGEVGPDAQDDDPERGPRGYDEVNQARGPGFFGWPYFVGDNYAYRDYDFASGISGAAYDPARPINDSPNNTGTRELPPAQPAFVWYPYAESEQFPRAGTGGRNAMAGPVYHYDDYPDTDVKWPRYYDGKLLIYDWMRDWIMAVTMDAAGDLVQLEHVLPATLDVSNTVDMTFGPDGSLYLLEYGKGWFSQNLDARLSRITYNGGNRTPEARLVADGAVGATPLAVRFSADESHDYDADALRYSWDFDGDGTIDAEGPTATHTYTEPGIYTAVLTVTDADGAASRATAEVLAGNALPELAVAVRGNRSFYFDDAPLAYTVSVTDAEDGRLGDGIAPEAVTVSLDYVAEGHDLAAAAQGHQALMTAAAAGSAGKELIAGSDCLACHGETSASVGPSFEQIAERYQGQDVDDYLVQKVIKGGGGVWGERSMSAHPQLSEEQAGQMVAYIRSFAEGEGGSEPSLPLDGTVALDAHEEGETSGRYLLTASYTDAGSAGIGPITAQEMVLLRHPRVEAEAYDRAEGAVAGRLAGDLTGGPEPDGMRGRPGDYLVYEQIDLTGLEAVTAVVAGAPGLTAGGRLEVRRGATDGPVLATIDVPVPTSPSLTEVTAPLSDADGMHDLYVVFAGEGGGRPVAGVDAFIFRAKRATIP